MGIIAGARSSIRKILPRAAGETAMSSDSRLKAIIRAARGEDTADLLLANGHVVNVFSGEVFRADVAIAGGLIAGVGSGYQARETIDLEGAIVCPGFIDGHLHIESTMLSPFEFARAVVPRGTSAVVSDPHEIANVLGLSGIRYMLDASEGLPLDVFVMASSCVPATHMESAGASLSAGDLAELLGHPRVLGLAEMMNYPGVLFQVEDVLAKLDLARKLGVPIDGHAPGLTGRDLQAYVATGVRSDHECTRAEEALEKLRAGMYVYIREGTTERNLADLLPIVNPATARRCLLVSDDRHPDDLMDRGHLDHSIRLAVEHGLDAVTAIQMVTLNPAERFRLHDRGAVAPGYRADLVVLDSLRELRVRKVFHSGALVAEDGRMSSRARPAAATIAPSVHVAWDRLDLAVRATGSRLRVIRVIEGQIVTRADEVALPAERGPIEADVSRDLLKLAVIERHHATGRIGLGFVTGMGLKRGAIAGTVAHDSHNLIVVGTNDRDMMAAARAIADMGGGLVAVSDGRLLACLPLPVAGLMSDRPLEEVRAGMDALIAAARAGLGSPLANPFMTLSFLALPVIPKLKLTDRGLVDVEKFEIVPLTY